MFDITSMSAKDSFTLQLRHPVSDELLFADGDAKTQPIQIHLYSPGSSEYKNTRNKLLNQNLKRNQKKVTAETVREDATELLARCSISADNFEYKGESLSDVNAFRDLYSDNSLFWIRDQVDTALSDNTNFLAE